jgi:hypothetical protein
MRVFIRERPVEISGNTKNIARGIPVVIYYLIPEKYSCNIECYYPEIVECRVRR